MKKIVLFTLLLILIACGNETELRGEAIKQNKQTNIDIEDTYWRLVSIKGENIDIGSNPYIFLNKINNIVNGYTGLNSLSAIYNIGKSELIFEDISITGRYNENLIIIEDKFLDTLSRVETYLAIGSSLKLYTDTGELLAEFRAEI